MEETVGLSLIREELEALITALAAQSAMRREPPPDLLSRLINLRDYFTHEKKGV